MNDDRPFRAPAFMRRNLASAANDEVLVALACDENMWVRREAVRNPATPRWIIDLLISAGTDGGLRGRCDPDPEMPPDDLRRLVECGPWAQMLVADHPNTSNDVLRVLAAQPSARTRAAVAQHPSADGPTLAHLCADGDAEIRRHAAANPTRPDAAYQLLRRAGSDSELAALEPTTGNPLGPGELVTLAELGPWGLFLAGRRPLCPGHVLADVAADPDWRVRSALLDNSATPDDLLERATESPPPHHDLRPLADIEAAANELAALARHPQSEVRLALARHPNTPTEALTELATDRSADVRRLAARHPNLDPGHHDELVGAGSSRDLTMLSDPDPDLDPESLDRLARGGHWARHLAVRHPATAPDTLARLLCDSDGKLREWAAAHSSAPPGVIAEIRRVGGADDFQGIADPDPDAPVEMLRRVAALGPWGTWVVSWHPNAPADLARPSSIDR